MEQYTAGSIDSMLAPFGRYDGRTEPPVRAVGEIHLKCLLVVARREYSVISDEVQTGRSRVFIGPWLSLVERLVRDEEAASSNLAGPTNS